MNEGRRAEAWMWDRYWRSGRADCCAGGAKINFEPLWQSHFAAFPAGSKLLDLATGGGYVTRLALATGDRLGLAFAVTGIDFANTPPNTATQAAQGDCRLTVMGNVRMEVLPFGDAIFDGISSQFGFEYAELEPAASEAARVLKPAGRGLFVLHHADSEITKAAAARLAAHRSAMEGQRPFRLAQRVFNLHGLRKSGPELSQAESDFRASVTTMQSRLAPGDYLENLSQALAFLADLAQAPESFDPVSALRKLKQVEDEVLSWEELQRVQLAAALDRSQLESLTDQLRRHGLQIAAPEVQSDPQGAILAWKLVFHKPS